MIFYTTARLSCPEIPVLLKQEKQDPDIAASLNYKQAAARDRFLATRACLRALVHHVTGSNAGVIAQEITGKPFFETTDGSPAPRISLAHTGDRIACAVSMEQPVGIDVETCRPRAFAALAAAAFGPREQAAVARGGADSFYKIWTLREARAKATGEGLALVMNGQDLCATAREGFLTEEDWHFYSAPLPPEHRLALAAPAIIEAWGPETLREVSLAALIRP